MTDYANNSSGMMRALPPLGKCGWVDLHNHLLPGIDDGPRDWHDSLALCRALVADGVTHAAATSHLFGPYTEPDRVHKMVTLTAELVKRLDDAGIALEIYQGADVRIDSQWEHALPEASIPTLGRGGRFILIEQPNDVWIPAPVVCRMLEASAYVGVLTHPERHPHIQKGGAPLLQEWVDKGVILQVTAGALLGDFGDAAQGVAWDIVESPIKAIVASDAHNTARRPPRMAAAAAAIRQRMGQAHTMRLCRDTPWELVSDTRPTTALLREKQPASKTTKTGLNV